MAEMKVVTESGNEHLCLEIAGLSPINKFHVDVGLN